MLPIIPCSLQTARRAALRHQGLQKGACFGKGKQAVVQAIEALGYLQIDTISVVDRAHHHVLKTRIKDYRPAMLDELQAKDRRVFEYWSHAAAYLSTQDYRFYLPMMHGVAAQESHDTRLTRRILAQIAAEGPMQSKDFEHQRDRQSNGWWDWKPAKRSLEHLFLSGQLMVSKRVGFAKVYDLTERVLPSDIDTRMPDVDEWTRFTLLRSLRAMGIGTLSELTYARTSVRRFTAANFLPDYAGVMQRLLDKEEVRAIDVAGTIWYALPNLFELPTVRLDHSRVQFLSPFDNLIINRSRTLRLFDFDYQLECYLPATKRRYGYFCMPILWGEQLIGRLDCKADRKVSTLRVHSLQIEPTQKLTDALLNALKIGIQAFAEDLNCSALDLSDSVPAELRRALA